MNKNELNGKWFQAKGTIMEKWGKITNDVYDQIDGSYDRLVGKIQELYGITTEEAKKQIDELFEDKK